MRGPTAALCALLLAGGAGWAGAQSLPAPTAEAGQPLFRARCGGCHLERGFGTRVLARRVAPDVALLEQRTDLSADYVRTVVRRGIGAMPMIRAEELSDAQLGDIARYLGKGN